MDTNRLYGSTNLSRMLEEIDDLRGYFDNETYRRYLDFLIGAMKNEIAAVDTGAYIWSDYEKLGDYGFQLFPHEYTDETGVCHSFLENNPVSCDLSKTTVISRTNKQNRMFLAISDFFKNGFVFDKTNHAGIYLEGIDALIVTNGYHHSAVAGYYRKGTFLAKPFHTVDFLRYIRTDARFWKDNNGNILGSVEDFRYAFLFEVYRKKLEYENRF